MTRAHLLIIPRREVLLVAEQYDAVDAGRLALLDFIEALSVSMHRAGIDACHHHFSSRNISIHIRTLMTLGDFSRATISPHTMITFLRARAFRWRFFRHFGPEIFVISLTGFFRSATISWHI